MTDALVDSALRFMFGIVGRLIPFRACGLIARPVADIAWLAGFRRQITLTNLSAAFPNLSPRQRRRLGRRSLRNLMTVMVEMLAIRHLDDGELADRLVVENIDLLHRLDGRGALLMSGHLGNWELLAVGAAALSGVPFTVVVKDQRHGDEVVRMRTSRGNSLISTGRGARDSTALLRSGGVLALLADQSASDRDHLIPMFGVPTHWFSAPARMALRYRPAVILGFAARERGGRYRVVLRELKHDDLPDTPEGALRFTERYVAALEAIVREHPDQWVWAHRRWKHTPGIRYS